MIEPGFAAKELIVGVGRGRVVALTGMDCPELFPLTSYAETVYVYVVAGVRPLSA